MSIAWSHKHIDHISQQICRCIYLLLSLHIYLFQGLNIFILVNTQLSRCLTELLLIRILRQHLSSDNTAQHGSILQCDRNTKIHKSRMAGIHTMAFSVTLLAALFSLCASSRQINTELRKIITVTDVFSVCIHSHGCQSRAVCPVLHNLLEFVHVTKILNLHITSYFPGHLNRWTHKAGNFWSRHHLTFT